MLRCETLEEMAALGTGNRDDYIRPSALSALALCPGSASLQAAYEFIYGKAKDAKQASMGTLAHLWGALGIKLLVYDEEGGEVYTELAELEWALAELRIQHECAEPKRKLDRWSWWCVEFYVTKVHELAVLHGVKPENILVEHHLTMDGLGLRKEGGTSDCILVVPFKLAVVVDAKFGFLDQEDAVDHDQLSAYAIGASRDLDVPVVHVAIVAPRADRDKRVTMGKFDAESLRQATLWIDAITRRARAPDPELSPNYTSCLYCKALTRCKPAREWFMNVLEALKHIGDPANPDQWAELAGAQAIARRFADDAKELCKARLTKGQPIPGWKLGSTGAVWSLQQVALGIELLTQKGLGEMATAAMTLRMGELSDEAKTMLKDAGYAKEVPKEASLKPVKGEKSSVP